MDIFSVFTLLGGLAFFLYGMNVMSSGLEIMAGGKLEKTLLKMTSNKYMGMLFGAGITVVIQSSSALTVMLVGLVNSGIMNFGRAISVIMGSNVGTTLTAWILSLAGIDGGAWYIDMLKPANFAAVFAFVGILFYTMSKNEKKKCLGSIFIGFAVLMFGMTFMSKAMEPLAASEGFKSVLTAFSNPLIAVVIGAVFTGIIQSSAASVGILQALSITSTITYGTAIPIIMGQNIGTCVTVLLASIGVSKNAKKVSVVHLAFNIIGTLVILIPLLIVNAIFTIPFWDERISPFMIAVCHSIFNLATTVLLIPFTKQLEALANRIIKTDDVVDDAPMLDERLITVPTIAVASANEAMIDMANISVNSIEKAISLISKYDDAVAAEIKELEERVDKYEDRLGTYMVKLARSELSEADSRRISKMLHTMNDFERISDHACNLVSVAQEINEKNMHFSDEATEEIATLTEALREILRLTLAAFDGSDPSATEKVEPLEQIIDKIIARVKRNHINRLQSGICTIEHGFVLRDLLTNYERVSDHCSNIAVAIIETEHGSFQTHEYLQAVKSGETGDFRSSYDEYKRRFIHSDKAK